MIFLIHEILFVICNLLLNHEIDHTSSESEILVFKLSSVDNLMMWRHYISAD